MCQFSLQTTYWRYTEFWQPSLRCGRSPVVFTEGPDLGPLDRGRCPEACEIGGLGTRACQARNRTARQGGPTRLVRVGVDYDRSVTKLWPGRGRKPQYPLPRAEPLGPVRVGQLPG